MVRSQASRLGIPTAGGLLPDSCVAAVFLSKRTTETQVTLVSETHARHRRSALERCPRPHGRARHQPDRTGSQGERRASDYYGVGDLARAIPLCETTLAQREQVLGDTHPSTLTSRNNLAYTYQAAGDLARAIPLYETTHSASRSWATPTPPHTP
jgi:hypothetical protein